MTSEFLDATNTTSRLRGTPVSAVEPIRDRPATQSTRDETARTGASEPTSENDTPPKEQIRELVEQVRPALKDLELEVDDTADRFVVRIRDRETGEVLSQIPSEDLLELARSLKAIRDNQAGGLSGPDLESSAVNPPKGMLIRTSV